MFFVEKIGINLVANLIGKLLEGVSDKLKADQLMYQLGLKIREKTPSNVIEVHIAHLIKYFKKGLKGEDVKFN